MAQNGYFIPVSLKITYFPQVANCVSFQEGTLPEVLPHQETTVADFSENLLHTGRQPPPLYYVEYGMFCTG